MTNKTQRYGFDYCVFFCEENILRLYDTLMAEGKEDLSNVQVLVVSTELKSCEYHAQRLGKPPQFAVYWDYHVILLQKTPNGDFVWDFDSTLGIKTPALEYFRASFPPSSPHAKPYRAHIRAFDAKHYAKHFASERIVVDPEKKRDIQYPHWPIYQRGYLVLERCIDFYDPALPPFIPVDAFSKQLS